MSYWYDSFGALRGQVEEKAMMRWRISYFGQGAWFLWPPSSDLDRSHVNIS